MEHNIHCRNIRALSYFSLIKTDASEEVKCNRCIWYTLQQQYTLAENLQYHSLVRDINPTF